VLAEYNIAVNPGPATKRNDERSRANIRERLQQIIRGEG